MTENYINSLWSFCIYLWKQSSAVNPCNIILTAYARCRFSWISLLIVKAREELNTRRVSSGFRFHVFVDWMLFSLFKMNKGVDINGLLEMVME